MAKKILVVDDDKVIQQLLTVNLELEGYDVVTANDGAAALERVATEKPDLVILDIMMPKFDGWEVCRRIKAHPKTAKTPVIFVSARAQDLDVRKGFELGVGAYVTKPFDPVELLDIIKRVLKGEQFLPSDT